MRGAHPARIPHPVHPPPAFPAPWFSSSGRRTFLPLFVARSARQMELSKDPYWHTLLHYKKTFWGFRSLVDDPRFFLDPAGKYDPQAELEATLRSLFDREEDEKRHSVCRFIARYHWLADRLKIDPSRLPVPECRRFSEMWTRSSRPRSP